MKPDNVALLAGMGHNTPAFVRCAKCMCVCPLVKDTLLQNMRCFVHYTMQTKLYYNGPLKSSATEPALYIYI